MTYLFGALAGIAWGFLGACLNLFIMKKAIAKNTNKAMLLCNFFRTSVDFIVLAVVFLLRNILPFSFTAAIVGAAAALSLTTIVFSFMMMKK